MIVQGIDQRSVVDYVNKSWRRLKDERAEKEARWQECLLADNAEFGQAWAELEPYRSKRYLAISSYAVNSVSSQLTQAVMPHDQWFDVLGRTPSDEANAVSLSALCRWQHFRMGFRSQVVKLLKAAGIFGNVPWCMTWRSEMQEIPDSQAREMQQQVLQAVQQSQMDPSALPPEAQALLQNPNPTRMVRAYDGPWLEVGNIFDFVMDRRPNNPKTAFRIHRFHRTKEYLEAMNQPGPNGYRLYENIEALGNEQRDKEASDSLRRGAMAEVGFNDRPEDAVELKEAWGDFPVKNEAGETILFQNYVAVVGGTGTLLRFEPNPYLHGFPAWQMFTLRPNPNDAYGFGILEPNLGLQDTINVRLNQVIEANALATNPMFTYVEDGIFNPATFFAGPGAAIPVGQQGNIQPFVVPNPAMQAMQEIGFLMGQFNELTGSMKSFTNADNQKSATEVAAVAGASSSMASEAARHIEQTFLLPCLNMQIALNQQLMDEATWIRVAGEPGLQIQNGQVAQGVNIFDRVGGSYPVGPNPGQAQLRQIGPQDIVGQFDVSSTGSSEFAESQQRLSQTIQLANVLLSSGMGFVFKPAQLARNLFYNAGVRDAWKFIKTDAEVMLEQQQPSQGMADGRGQGGPGKAGAPSGNGGVQSMAGSPGDHSAPTDGVNAGQRWNLLGN